MTSYGAPVFTDAPRNRSLGRMWWVIAVPPAPGELHQHVYINWIDEPNVIIGPVHHVAQTVGGVPAVPTGVRDECPRGVAWTLAAVVMKKRF